ncbi:hypothetical protein [Streptomyces sp. NPDC057616]|uniref:hypothetical protein n=1 Tax=Streptomyces sp. NPDC057616 TaxID=3346183 RepID=UPI00367FBE3D
MAERPTTLWREGIAEEAGELAAGSLGPECAGMAEPVPAGLLTLFDLPAPEEPEHSVIARYCLSDDQYGSPAERLAIFDAERTMAAAVTEAGVGEVDGNGFGSGEAELFAYGPDAEALFKVMEPALRGLPFRPAYVVLRRGSRGRESRVDL